MKKQVVGFLLVMFFISFVSASFQFVNLSGIEEKYSPSDFLRGWVNMSFSNHPGDSVFNDSLGNSINLINFLKSNNANYSCNPSDCGTDYSSSNPQTSGVLTLNKNQIAILGLKLIGGNFNSVSSFNMKISSNAPESNSPQLYIDILDDGELDWIPYNSSNNFYGKSYGCFETGEEEVFVYNQQYCNKITLPLSPSVEIGAVLKNATGGSATFKFSICTSDFSNCGYCETNISSSGETSCVPNFHVTKIDSYFVCINAKSSADNNKYKINSETKNSCGYASSSDNPRDFEIFAMPSKYSSLEDFNLNNTELGKSGNFIKIENNINNYVGERLGNDCSSDCVIPIKFISGENQEITISEINVLYSSSGTQKESTAVYELNSIAPKITMAFKKIFFDYANFSISGEENSSINYTLNFDGKKILTKQIKITNFPKIKKLIPKTAIAAYPTEFRVEMENLNVNNSNSLTYKWEFGDGNQQTTQVNKVTHTYNSTGNLTMKITVQNSNFVSQKQFNISIQNPKNAINSVLGKKLSDLSNITKQIGNFELPKQDSIKRAVNFSFLETQLSALQQQSKVATSDNDYIRIMSELIVIDVPIKIYKSQQADSLIFFPKKENINVNIVGEITGENYSVANDNSYRDAIIAWELDNAVSRISTEEFSGDYEDYVDPIVKFFTIEIMPETLRGDSFFIIKKLDNLEFNQNYNEKISGDYYYIEISTSGKTIEFSTTESVDFENLEAFISPKISDLPRTIINISEGGEIISKRSILVFSAIFALLIGFASYLFLQEWYKRRYESYLFGNRNDLLNLVSYIQNAYKKGIQQKEIETKLKKSGWTSEQISYVMRKYVGKRTGMLEIPVSKVFGFFKKEDVKK